MVDVDAKPSGWNPGRQLRGVGERYKEQVAEDITWDIIDEVDFFMQDGGFAGFLRDCAETIGFCIDDCDFNIM